MSLVSLSTDSVPYSSTPAHKSPGDQNKITSLATPVISKIFNQLDSKDLSQIALVSKDWQDMFLRYAPADSSNPIRMILNNYYLSKPVEKIIDISDQFGTQPLPVTRNNYLHLKDFFNVPENYRLTQEQIQKLLKPFDRHLDYYLETCDKNVETVYKKLRTLSNDSNWRKEKIRYFLENNQHLLHLDSPPPRQSEKDRNLSSHMVQLDNWIDYSSFQEYKESSPKALCVQLHRKFKSLGNENVSLNIRYVTHSKNSLSKAGVEVFLNNLILPTNVTSLQLFGGPAQIGHFLGYLLPLNESQVPLLCKVIAKNSSLKELHLPNSNISLEGLSKLNEMMESSGGRVTTQYVMQRY